MTQAQLNQYNGAAIEFCVDGAEVVGLLFLAEHAEVYVMSMCYTNRRMRCPQVQHVLSSEEIQNITLKTRNKLHSTIDVASKGRAKTSSHQPLDAAGSSSGDLIRRAQKNHARARRLKAEFEQLKTEGEALVGKLQKVQGGAFGAKRKTPPRTTEQPL